MASSLQLNLADGDGPYGAVTSLRKKLCYTPEEFTAASCPLHLLHGPELSSPFCSHTSDPDSNFMATLHGHGPWTLPLSVQRVNLLTQPSAKRDFLHHDFLVDRKEIMRTPVFFTTLQASVVLTTEEPLVLLTSINEAPHGVSLHPSHTITTTMQSWGRSYRTPHRWPYIHLYIKVFPFKASQ